MKNQTNYKKRYPNINPKQLSKKSFNDINLILNEYNRYKEFLKDSTSALQYNNHLEYLSEVSRTEKNILRILESESIKRKKIEEKLNPKKKKMPANW